jgi:hypothetical protein
MRALLVVLLLVPAIARADVDLDAFCAHTMKAANPAQCYGRDAQAEATKRSFCAETLGDLQRAGRITIDPAKLAACERAAVAGLATLPNERNIAHLAEAFAACRGVAIGHQALGAECVGTMECAAGLVCGQMKCVRPGVAGDKCSIVIEMTMADVHSTCGAGLYCDLKDYVCKKPHAKGATCVLTAECASGLSCRAGKCVTPRPAKHGESCDRDADCPAGDTCSSFDRCEAKRPDGAQCSMNSECQHRCVDDVCGPC